MPVDLPVGVQWVGFEPDFSGEADVFVVSRALEPADFINVSS